MKILLLKGASQYDALRSYIDQWNYILSKQGHETYLLDITILTSPEPLRYFIEQQRPDIVLACNAICSDYAEKFLHEQGRYVTVIYDNPFIHHPRLCNLGEKSVVFSCDRIYADYIRNTYPNIGIVDFLPLSGLAAPGKRIPYEKRKIPLIFTGSYFDLNAAYETLTELPAGLRELFTDVAEYMIQQPESILSEALDVILKKRTISLQEAERTSLLYDMSRLDLYLRAYFRDKMMRAVLEADVPVHIFGNGWDKFLCAKKNNIILENGYGEIALHMLRNSKISLNIMPWFRAGIQERNISAMLSGAVSLTDSSQYIEEEFCDGKDIALYSLHHLEALPEQITDLLEHTDQSSAIAEAAYQKAIQKHTWEHRIQQLLSVLG